MTSAASDTQAPTGVIGRAGATLRTVLIDEVPRNHQQSDHEFHRRRIVVLVGLVIGTILLGLSLATTPGSVVFYPLTISVAVVWVVFGFASGPLHLGYVPWRGALRRPIVTPLLLGLIASAVFVAGAFVIAQIEPLRSIVAHVLAHAQAGNLALVYVVTLLNGAAEEVFFRGALFAAIGRRHAIPISVVIYTLVTIATGNVMLVFAAVLMGTLFAVQRRASGGILAPSITHLVWSIVMLASLPAIIGT